MAIGPMAALLTPALLFLMVWTASATSSELLDLAMSGPNKIHDQGDLTVFKKFFEDIDLGVDVDLQSGVTSGSEFASR
jgi:hypothetical protein